MSESMIWASAGGLLIGAAAVMLYWFNGRIAGVSVIFYQASGFNKEHLWQVFFVLGLIVGAALYYWLASEPIPVPHRGGIGMATVAGLIVGFGTRLGGGCTSGHGVCGMARLSLRSIVATMVFILSAMLTVLLMGDIAV